MNVGELKSILEDIPDHLEILIAEDEEGNGFRKLYYGPGIYWIDSNADKHGYVETIYQEKDLETEDLNIEELEQRVVIWP